MTKLDELTNKMKLAVKEFESSGDMTAIQAVIAERTKAKAEIQKAEGAKLVAEAEALAGKRESLSYEIQSLVKVSPGIVSKLQAVKAKGFTFTIDHRETDKGVLDANGEVSVKGGVGLLVTSVKTRKGGTGGGAGKSKDEYGMSLADIVAKFATPEELAEISAEGVSNSKGWQLKVAVKKRAIAEGKLAPVK